MNEARNIVKMMQPTEQKIGGNTFYIYPLPAFTAANLSADVISLLAPLVGGIAGALGSGSQGDAMGEGKGLMDMDVSEAAPHIAGAFSSLSADKTERLLRNLLMNKNVVVKQEGSPDVDYLTEDKCNEIFCGNVQNMFILAFHVIKVNFWRFFRESREPIWQCEDCSDGSGISRYGTLDVNRFCELELRMYILIKQGWQAWKN